MLSTAAIPCERLDVRRHHDLPKKAPVADCSISLPLAARDGHRDGDGDGNDDDDDHGGDDDDKDHGGGDDDAAAASD